MSFDQSPLGHECQKPTRIGTNCHLLKELGKIHDPMDSQPENPMEEELPGAAEVRRAQAIAGKLLYLSGKIRPDIAMGVSKVSQWVTHTPVWTYNLDMNILRYLKSCPE